jgi:hypothetical protein
MAAVRYFASGSGLCIVLYCIYYTFQHIHTRQKPLDTELVTQHELAIIGKRHLNNAYKYDRK